MAACEALARGPQLRLKRGSPHAVGRVYSGHVCRVHGPHFKGAAEIAGTFWDRQCGDRAAGGHCTATNLACTSPQAVQELSQRRRGPRGPEEQWRDLGSADLFGFALQCRGPSDMRDHRRGFGKPGKSGRRLSCVVP